MGALCFCLALDWLATVLEKALLLSALANLDNLLVANTHQNKIQHIDTQNMYSYWICIAQDNQNKNHNYLTFLILKIKYKKCMQTSMSISFYFLETRVQKNDWTLKLPICNNLKRDIKGRFEIVLVTSLIWLFLMA